MNTVNVSVYWDDHCDQISFPRVPAVGEVVQIEGEPLIVDGVNYEIENGQTRSVSVWLRW